MAQSLNTVCDYTTKGCSHSGFSDYGQIMIGDKAFEFYSDRDVRKHIQIPWEDIDVIMCAVYFKGKYIPRIGLKTYSNGTFYFSSREAMELLQHIRKRFPVERMYRSWTFWDVLKINFSHSRNQNPQTD